MARILVLCSRTPYPLTGGAKIRMFHTARLLATANKVDLLIVDEEPVDDGAIEQLNRTFDEVTLFTYPKRRFHLGTVPGLVSRRPLQTHYFSISEVHNWVADNVSRYDLLYCNHVRTTEYARDFSIPKVVDLVDAISRNYETAGVDASGIWSAIYPLEARRLRHYERTVVREFDRSFVVTEADRRHIIGRGACSSFSVVPNGVRPEVLERGPYPSVVDGPPRIVFLGKMDYFPNEDAATYFANDIFPKIRESVPETEFVIVGTSPTEQVRGLADRSGITVTGFVDEPLDHLEGAHVVVAPMRHGAGLQNKVLEAMGLGKPVVTTSLGCEGIDATEGEHLAVADDPDEMSNAVCSLLAHEDRRRTVGSAARDLIERKYTWKSVAPDFLDSISAALQQ